MNLILFAKALKFDGKSWLIVGLWKTEDFSKRKKRSKRKRVNKIALYSPLRMNALCAVGQHTQDSNPPTSVRMHLTITIRLLSRCVQLCQHGSYKKVKTDASEKERKTYRTFRTCVTVCSSMTCTGFEPGLTSFGSNALQPMGYSPVVLKRRKLKLYKLCS